MEEILASIRRIIEDSDNGRQAGEPATVVAAPPAAQREVETFRSELGPAANAPGQRPATPPVAAPAVPAARGPEPEARAEAAPKTFRLAEVQAQIAREAVAEQKPAGVERRPVTLGDVQRDIANASAPPQPVALVPSPAAKVDPPRPVEVQPEPKHEPAPVVQPVEHERPKQELRPAPAPEVANPLPAVELRREQAAPRPELAGKPVMISPTASRQIAASFNELSEAFAQRSKRTFDELAEQMLRPMLQDWLDNNLPLLVERLVREEIERVARGD